MDRSKNQPRSRGDDDVGNGNVIPLRPAAKLRKPKPPKQIHGVKIESRYEDAEECLAIVNAVNTMQIYPRCVMQKIFCDSKSDNYLIVLRECADEDLARIAQDAADALGARLTHSGICVNAYDSQMLGGRNLYRLEGNCGW